MRKRRSDEETSTVLTGLKSGSLKENGRGQ